MQRKSLPILLAFSFLYVGASAQQQNIHHRLDSLIRAVNKIENGDRQHADEFKRFLEDRKYKLDYGYRNITDFLLDISKRWEEQTKENEKLKRQLDKQEDLIKRQENQLKELERKIDNLERKIK